MEKLNFSEMSKYGEGMLYWTEVHSRGLLKKTKRRITQEMEEWDEDVEEGDNRSEPELEWGFMADKTESKPGLSLKDVEDKDLEAVHVETDDVKKEIQRLNYPEVEGDLAPSAIVPKACQSIQKQVSKLESLLGNFLGGKELSMLQNRMTAKLKSAVEELSKLDEILIDQHGQGVLDGFDYKSRAPAPEKKVKESKESREPKLPGKAKAKAKATAESAERSLKASAGQPTHALQGDIFHIHKLGAARDVIGGVLIILLRLGFMDHEGSTKNMTDRFTRAHSYFAMWCSSNGKTPGLRSFSKAYFNLKTLVSAPWVNAKGSDSTLLLEWLDFTLRLNLQHPSVEGHTQLLRHMLQLVESSLAVRMVHTHRLWLERDCARRLYVKLMTVLRAYSVMAQSAMRLKIRAFVLKPKHHSLHHIAWFLKTELRKGAALIYNPQGYACEMNEDFVGRISRLSRRVGFRLCDKRVFERVFLKVTALLRRRKELRQSRSRSSRVKGKFRK
ncbi:unnamed protein product [Cladocopium goreaui]|uniref:Uncharacterized protein n=1 Tax=Cladocopium goreaui TaxID=2562237 RepID=A0A9P1CN77_9DINO|nr:unnamed protein product [Cladocopium goreaui]